LANLGRRLELPVFLASCALDSTLASGAPLWAVLTDCVVVSELGAEAIDKTLAVYIFMGLQAFGAIGRTRNTNLRDFVPEFSESARSVASVIGKEFFSILTLSTNF
jgi:hypothetical protein